MSGLTWVDVLAASPPAAVLDANTLPSGGNLSVFNAGAFEPTNSDIYLLANEITGVDQFGDPAYGGPTFLSGVEILGIEMAGAFSGDYDNPVITPEIGSPIYAAPSFDEIYIFLESPIIISGNREKILNVACWYPFQAGSGTGFTLTKLKVGFASTTFWTDKNLIVEEPL